MKWQRGMIMRDMEIARPNEHDRTDKNQEQRLKNQEPRTKSQEQGTRNQDKTQNIEQ